MMNYLCMVLANFFPWVVHYFLDRSFVLERLMDWLDLNFVLVKNYHYSFVEDVLIHHWSFVMENHGLHVREDFPHNEYSNVVCIVVND